MTKKTGLFDVDFTLTTKELTTSIKGEKITSAHYKPYKEAVGTISIKCKSVAIDHVLSRITI